ncbi:hypothetical protein C8R43DRAFT_1119180 [Mycena crocata]|nr:hypothetical protein C8R43DRAFT_1119180 [Mycena crocata]
MPLTLPIEELFTSQIEARLNVENGAIAFNFTPSLPGSSTLGTPCTGIRVHFKTRVDSNGVNVLSIFASVEEDEWPKANSCDERVLYSTQELPDISIDSVYRMVPTMSLPEHLAALTEGRSSFASRAIDCIPEALSLSNVGDVPSVRSTYPPGPIDQTIILSHIS